jgi:hypothetical protein
MFFTGGAMAMVIRAELFQPGLQLVEPLFFNQMTTVHGLIMVFGAVMPAFTGLANWLIPIMIGAPDMALPRMNNWSFWLLPPAAILLVGISRLLGRQLWMPAKVRDRRLPSDRLRPGLAGGLRWVQRLEKLSRPHRLRMLVDGRVQGIVNNLAFILAALLLMLPFGLVPFSNTLPALALLAYAIGFIQRDGVAVLLGHVANVGTIVYFSVLIGGGGLVAQELFKRFGA